jgi:hypothetical protein
VTCGLPRGCAGLPSAGMIDISVASHTCLVCSLSMGGHAYCHWAEALGVTDRGAGNCRELPAAHSAR